MWDKISNFVFFHLSSLEDRKFVAQTFAKAIATQFPVGSSYQLERALDFPDRNRGLLIRSDASDISILFTPTDPSSIFPDFSEKNLATISIPPRQWAIETHDDVPKPDDFAFVLDAVGNLQRHSRLPEVAIEKIARVYHPDADTLKVFLANAKKQYGKYLKVETTPEGTFWKGTLDGSDLWHQISSLLTTLPEPFDFNQLVAAQQELNGYQLHYHESSSSAEIEMTVERVKKVARHAIASVISVEASPSKKIIARYFLIINRISGKTKDSFNQLVDYTTALISDAVLLSRSTKDDEEITMDEDQSIKSSTVQEPLPESASSFSNWVFSLQEISEELFGSKYPEVSIFSINYGIDTADSPSLTDRFLSAVEEGYKETSEIKDEPTEEH